MKKPSELFFNHQSFYDLPWREEMDLRLGPVLPASKDKISKSLKDLSFESIRNRFMGSKKEFSEKELEYLTNLDGWNHYAIGIEEKVEPSKGVAIARLVRSSEDNQEAEVAITVIDKYQGQGLGTLLIRLITLAAYERDVKRLTFTTLPQNSSLLKLIQKIGTPVVHNVAMDYVVLNLDMKDVRIKEIKSQLVPILPSIGTFDSGI